LVDILLERLSQVLLGFLTHDVDLAGNPLVHLLLSLFSVLAFEFLGDLAYLGFCTILVMWLINFLLSRISKLVFDVGSTLLALGKLDEEVSEASVGEEPLLGFLGVLVHGVSDHLEDNRSTGNHLLDILLLEVMAQNDRQHS
jgi:hypothetical protein